MSRWKDAILDAAAALPPELAVVVVAALPVFELRGAVPLGMALGLDPARALLVAWIGNMIPIPFLLVLLDPVSRRLRRRVRLQRVIDWTYARTEAKSGSIRRYGWWGLVLFVAVPLPGTGAWTGALAASLLGYRTRSALVAIALGVALAGLVVTAVSVLGWNVLG